MLEEGVKTTIHSKQRAMLTNGVFHIMTTLDLLQQQQLLKQYEN
jgi:hypothetical protein